MTDSEIIADALTCGFMISTAFGQDTNKQIPVSDRATLLAFARSQRKQAREELLREVDICLAEDKPFSPETLKEMEALFPAKGILECQICGTIEPVELFEDGCTWCRTAGNLLNSPIKMDL